MKYIKYTPFTSLLLTLPIIFINWPRSLKVHTAVFTFPWFHKIVRELSYKPSFQFNSQLNGKKNKQESVVIHAWDFCLKRKCRPKKDATHNFFFLGGTWIKIYEDLTIWINLLRKDQTEFINSVFHKARYKAQQGTFDDGTRRLGFIRSSP